MAVTKTTTTSYGSRVKSSFGGIGTGFVMFLIGTCLLWWNEGRAVKTAKMLAEAEKVAVHIDDVSEVDPSLTGQLIHATAQAVTNEELQDENFGFSTVAIKLNRDVEYYQYVENTTSQTKDKLGGSQETTTTYTYKKSWTSSPVNSSEFEDPAYQGKNFTLMEFDDADYVSENVTFGGYTLNKSLIMGISGSVPSKLNIEESLLKAWDTNISRTQATPTSKALAEAAAKLAKETVEAADSTKSDSATTEVVDNRYEYVHVSKNVVYFGKNPNSPQIGDVRVTFTQVNPGLVSVLAQVEGSTFVPFKAKNGKTLSVITMGNKSMEQMFEQQEQANNTWLWVLRIIGILLVCGGLKGIFAILSTILKVVPFLSSIMNWGVNLICNIIGIAWSLIVIAIAWIFYRPVLAIAILAVVVGIVGYFVYRGKQKKPAEVEVPEAPAAPEA